MQDYTEYLSPAKLNLTFQVLRKRSDGYHDIASLFQAIDLCDRLFFAPSSQDELTCTDPSVPCDETNLVTKALHLFRHTLPFTGAFKIHIEKKIPTQAGLGGGSSNAATTLWALNELTGHPASLSQLIQMGAQLGSDVPFFFSSGTAYCTGRGEIMTPWPTQAIEGWLAKPPYGLSTPLVYKNTRLEELPRREPAPAYYNDLEIPAFRLEPRLIVLRKELLKSFSEVTMTGSGTAFFCLKGDPKPIEGITFYRFHSISRTVWYQ